MDKVIRIGTGAGVRHLNYQGDRTASVGQVLGPDSFGGLWKIVSASYSEETDKTTVGLNPHVSPNS